MKKFEEGKKKGGRNLVKESKGVVQGSKSRRNQRTGKGKGVKRE